MYDVGDPAVFTLTVGGHDGTTDVTVLVTAPDGSTSTPTPTPSGGGATWTLPPVVLTMAGRWYVTWTVNGAGAGSQTDSVEAEPLPPPSTEQQTVRLLISDTDASTRFFSTAELALFLAMNSNSPRRAAAQALDTMAANEAMVSKKIRTKDLQTDGPAVADALRKQAAELRRQADNGEDDTESTESAGFEIVEYEPYGRVTQRTDWFF